MSYVTTVLLATQWSGPAARRFEQIVREKYDRYDTPYEVTPTEQDGPKYGPGEVYYYGFNYAGPDLLDALRTEPWPDDTVLWIYGEDHDGPEIYVGGTCIRPFKMQRCW